jgi:hypothetical protein
MADFAGVSEQAFRKWMKLPGFPIASDSSVCLWDLAVWRHQMNAGSEFGDEIEGGSDSPGLERYRLARAEQEEIKLLKMRGEFLSREDVHLALAETSGVMKEAGEKVLRIGGNDLAEIINWAWDEVAKRIGKLFGDRTGGTTDESGSAAE